MEHDSARRACLGGAFLDVAFAGVFFFVIQDFLLLCDLFLEKKQNVDPGKLTITL